MSQSTAIVMLGQMPPFSGTFTQHLDVMTLKRSFINITTPANQYGLYAGMVQLNHFSWAGSDEPFTNNQMVGQ